MKAMICALLSLCFAVEAAERRSRDPRDMEHAVAVQVFLDRANFGPGKIDGHLGGFTAKALDRYRRAHGKAAPVVASAEPAFAPADAGSTGSSASPDAAPTSSAAGTPAPSSAPAEVLSQLPEPDPGSLPGTRGEPRRPDTLPPKEKRHEPKPKESEAKAPDTSDLDLKSIGDVFIQYTVSEADVAAVGEVPSKPEEQATLKWLPYASVAEAVAERFHMDVDFLEELNPGKTKALKAGDVVRVPNVEPFELAAVKNLKPGSALAAKGVNAQEQDEEKNGDADRKKQDKKKEEAPEPPSPISIVITKGENMLEVFDAGRMIAAFPVTVGSDETASPMGEWKVRGVAKLPEFRYDKKMLKEGERSSDFHMLPPGPNSPVGVIWIALNRKGIGIHGSDNPDAIGRNASHGCVRLANWDVVKLAAMVKGGVPVTIQ